MQRRRQHKDDKNVVIDSRQGQKFLWSLSRVGEIQTLVDQRKRNLNDEIIHRRNIDADEKKYWGRDCHFIKIKVKCV